MSERARGSAVWIATCGGVGYFPLAPGTAGSVVAVGATTALAMQPATKDWLWLWLSSLAVGTFWIGVWAGSRAEIYFGKKDPSQAVIDEVAGQLLTLAAIPEATWQWLLMGFLMFRALDILKPFPARRSERLPGGWGIMTDDFIAGAYSAALLAVAGRWID